MGVFKVCLTGAVWIGTTLAQSNPPRCDIYPVLGCETALQSQVRFAVESFKDAVKEKTAFNSTIAESRRKVAQNCRSSKRLRDHPEEIVELRNFLSLLDAKDLYFLSLNYNPLSLGPEYQQFNMSMEKATGFGHRLDGGIRSATGATWGDWIDAMNRDVRQNQSVPMKALIENYSALLTFKNSSPYLRYRLARNFVELGACGCNAISDLDEVWLALLIVGQPWSKGGGSLDDPQRSAQRYYEGLSKIFGVDNLHRAAKDLLESTKNKEGFVVPPQGELMSYYALGTLLSDIDGSTYTLSVLLGLNDPLRPRQCPMLAGG